MKVILNNSPDTTSFRDALIELIAGGAVTLSIAVSYMQVGGWELFRREAQGLDFARMRIVCTDQMGITHPEAVRRAIGCGADVRNFSGAPTYHPKVFIAHGPNGRPSKFLLGSANLSEAAFTGSVEAGVLGADEGMLATFAGWFERLFDHQSAEFTPDLLATMEQNWRAAASRRARASLRPQAIPAVPAEAGAVGDILSTLQTPIGLLNMDYARNNVRSIGHAHKVLVQQTALSGKQRSELKLLGFMHDGQLTPLGRAAAAATTDAEVARIWCRWLQQTPEPQLRAIRPELLVAKRVFSRFWEMKPEVRDYFLANAPNAGGRDQTSRNLRATLQAIELLCNADWPVGDLSLDEVLALAPLFRSDEVPAYIRLEVEEYFLNKGTRGWDSGDRETLLRAWHGVSG
jgi:hypothetical protein